MKAKRFIVKGVVQGVGFRPFVYRIALKNNLKGFVNNDSLGVIIEVEGLEKDIEEFKKQLISLAPKAAKIKEIIEKELSPQNFTSFNILSSKAGKEKEVFVPPDIATCEDCLRELFDPKDRRYKYPFINCTNCGPRYTIIEDIPYDRDKTTMKDFTMCDECESEYKDPKSRRFHAQPNACPNCGPWIEVLDSSGRKLNLRDPISFIKEELKKGKIVLLKGLGGFHLVCDASSHSAVKKVRKIKERRDKPLAIMVPDIKFAKKIAYISSEEEKLLKSSEAPIVILDQRENTYISSYIAPNLNNIGIMLPYTPIHHLLLRKFNGILVMTSGNLSQKPIVYRNQEALETFKGKVDLFVIHNRKIHIRIDDSVIKSMGEFFISIRKARGYTPLYLDLKLKSPKKILALGGMLKATFTLLKKDKAILSQYFGDLEEYDNLNFYMDTLNHFKKLFNFEPELITCDMHPDYPTTSIAEKMSKRSNCPVLKVQHHIAHILSVLGEHNSFDQPIVGFAFDGTGYGLDGKIWGGEIFWGDPKELKRIGHIDYFCLPTGEKAIKEPWRSAFSFLFFLFNDKAFDKKWCKTREKLLKLKDFKNILTSLKHPMTSSVGRLLDAISSILDIRDKITYEAQAAIELEALADKGEKGFYKSPIKENSYNLDPYSLIEAVVFESERGVSKEVISARVHNTLVEWIVKSAEKIRDQTGINLVTLSGGVFQNRFILTKSVKMFKKKKFKVLFNQQIPINDSGISFGQAVFGVLNFQKA